MSDLESTPLCAFSEGDHIGNLTEMILEFVPAILASQFGFLDHVFKIAIVSITQYCGEIAGRPEFIPGLGVDLPYNF